MRTGERHAASAAGEAARFTADDAERLAFSFTMEQHEFLYVIDRVAYRMWQLLELEQQLGSLAYRVAAQVRVALSALRFFGPTRRVFAPTLGERLLFPCTSPSGAALLETYRSLFWTAGSDAVYRTFMDRSSAAWVLMHTADRIRAGELPMVPSKGGKGYERVLRRGCGYAPRGLPASSPKCPHQYGWACAQCPVVQSERESVLSQTTTVMFRRRLRDS